MNLNLSTLAGGLSVLVSLSLLQTAKASDLQKLPKESVLVSASLEKGDLYYDADNGEYLYQTEKGKTVIHPYDLDPALQGLTSAELSTYLSHGYLSLEPSGDGLALHAQAELKGGGPIAYLACLNAAALACAGAGPLYLGCYGAAAAACTVLIPAPTP